MLGRARTEDLLKQVLSTSPVDETEAILLGLDEQLTRFANNAIHQHVAEMNRYVVVRAVIDRRSGVAATNDLTQTGLQRVLESACRAATVNPIDPDFPGLPEQADIAQVEAFDRSTATCSPAERARPISVICRKATALDCVASGAFRTSVHEFAVANDHGLFAYHPATSADLTVVVMTEDSSGYAADASWRVRDIDVVVRGEEAIRKAVDARHPQTIDAGIYPVVLEPYAAHDILATLCRAAGADPVQEGRSWISGRQGDELMSPLISIWDDGLDPAGWPLPFDFEGTPRRRVDIVRRGVVEGAVYDRERTTEEEGQGSTGHALPPANPFNPWLNNSRLGPIPLQRFMAPGETSIEEMIAST